VSEVLGDKIVPMFNAMNSGAAGSMCTLHGGAMRGGTGHDTSMHFTAPTSPVQAGIPALVPAHWRAIPFPARTTLALLIGPLSVPAPGGSHE
jgi:hypothetical protein